MAPSGRPSRGTDAGTVQSQRVRSTPANGNVARARAAADSDRRNALAATSTASAAAGAARAGRATNASPAAPAAASRIAAVRVSCCGRFSPKTDPPSGARRAASREVMPAGKGAAGTTPANAPSQKPLDDLFSLIRDSQLL